MSKELVKTINDYEKYIDQHGITEKVTKAYSQAAAVAFNEPNIPYAFHVSTRAKELLNTFTMNQTGGDLWELEKYSFAHKVSYDIVKRYYDILLVEAKNKSVDSFFRYVEHKREPLDRFYMPRRKHFAKHGITEALQGLIDDRYDIICISMVPGAGKTTVEKFFNAAVIGWYPKDFNLFYTHSDDLARMYYDGIYDIVTNHEEYAWNEIFPDLKVTSSNAKIEQFNVGSYKPFSSVQCTTYGSKNAGKVRANKFLLVDDMIGKLEEALNPAYLEKLWNAYSVDARQRKIPDLDGTPCKEAHFATRWSHKDVIGRVQQAYEGNKRVKIIAIPDVDPITGKSNYDYEYGGYTEKDFEDIRLLMDEISYRCLYKQDPVEREGLLFPEEKIRRYLNLPHGEPTIITAQCDTKGKGTDYFVLPVLAKYGEDYYCIDCVCDNSSNYELQYENAANVLVNNKVQECEFERNAGGDRVAMEVNRRVEQKGWICNIIDTPTETNKEARIYQCSNWILQHVVFKDQSLYHGKDHYGTMMTLLKQYTITGKKQLDDVPDAFSNFAVRMTKKEGSGSVEAVKNPFRAGGYRYGY